MDWRRMCGLNRVDLSYCEAQLSSDLLEYQSKPAMFNLTTPASLTGLYNWTSGACFGSPNHLSSVIVEERSNRDVVFMRADPRQLVPDAAQS
jgi:hypothetical protein